MKAGKLATPTGARLVITSNDSELYDWAVFDHEAVPELLRNAVAAVRQTPNNTNFCAALPLVEEFLQSDPDFLNRSGDAIACDPSIRFLPPVTPQNFLCLGLNYIDHAKETNLKVPSEPLLFAKTVNALAGHNQPVHMPCGSTQVDYEAELVIVIGHTCRHFGVENALSCIAGYTCGNDVTARDFQFGDGQWYRGKSIDGFGPIGPWIATPATVGDPHQLRIQLRLNGRTMQDSNTANLIFRVPEIVAYISRNITLLPGDVIMTGTPPGVGFTRKPPVWVKAGDVMEVEIEKIGVLRNEVAAVTAGNRTA